MTAKQRIVGVIGGMGPAATVDFMERVLCATPAATDQDHVRMVIDQNPRIPSRQLAMRGEGEDPGPTLGAMAAGLEQSGADFLVMPCNLAHAWQSDIEAACSIPFVSIIEESVRVAVDSSGDDQPVGLLTTPGCFAAGVYQQALSDAGRPAILQTPDELTATMAAVNKIKSGDLSAAVATDIEALGNALIARGARVLLAACTEFPLVLTPSMFKVAYVPTTEVLAKKTVALALGADDLPHTKG